MCNVSDRVGPWGKWDIMSASGTPRVSCRRRRSVTFWDMQACKRSGRTVFPRFRRYEFGKTSRSSYKECVSERDTKSDVSIRRQVRS